MTQVELSFPTLDSALRYAERHGLSYTVHGRNGSAQDEQPAERSYSASEKLGLQDLQGARNGGGPRSDALCRWTPSARSSLTGLGSST